MRCQSAHDRLSQGERPKGADRRLRVRDCNFTGKGAPLTRSAPRLDLSLWERRRLRHEHRPHPATHKPRLHPPRLTGRRASRAAAAAPKASSVSRR